MNKFSLIWKTPSLRNKIFIVLALLIVTRVLAHIPIPGVDIGALSNALAANQFLSLLNLFAGGGLTYFSIAMLGIGPYITASIIIQLLTIIVPSLKELQKEGGEAGRMKLNQYTRYITIPLAVLQGFGTIRLLMAQGQGQVLTNFTSFQWFLTLLSVTAGTMLIVWIGEIISEYGMGNGSSLIIFAGIVARIPTSAISLYNLYIGNGISAQDVSVFIGFLAVVLLVIAGVVLITEAQRNIPITYAKHMRGDKMYGGVSTHLPLRLNQAGVIPIIFAISLMIFPALLAQFFVNARAEFLRNLATHVISIFNPNSPGWAYGVIYFAFVVIFTYFYTAIVFNPEEVAENVQKNGGFIPGTRPGRQTADYLYKVLNRVTLPGALFLGAIAILPFILQYYTGIQALSFGGTSLLIVVAVVIDTLKQIDAQLTMYDYDTLS